MNNRSNNSVHTQCNSSHRSITRVASGSQTHDTICEEDNRSCLSNYDNQSSKTNNYSESRTMNKIMSASPEVLASMQRSGSYLNNLDNQSCKTNNYSESRTMNKITSLSPDVLASMQQSGSYLGNPDNQSFQTNNYNETRTINEFMPPSPEALAPMQQPNPCCSGQPMYPSQQIFSQVAFREPVQQSLHGIASSAQRSGIRSRPSLRGYKNFPSVGQDIQQRQQVGPTFSYPVPPYATYESPLITRTKPFCKCASKNPPATTYGQSYVAFCTRCGQYHEYPFAIAVPVGYQQTLPPRYEQRLPEQYEQSLPDQYEQSLPDRYRPASAIFQHVPTVSSNAAAPTKTSIGPSIQPYPQATNTSRLRNLQNIREEPTRDCGYEEPCGSVPNTGLSQPNQQYRPSCLKQSSMLRNDANPTDICMPCEAGNLQEDEPKCIPCEHPFPESPDDTCWRVKLLKEVGTQTYIDGHIIPTQTSETRIINAAKLEELLPPSERFSEGDGENCLCLNEDTSAFPFQRRSEPLSTYRNRCQQYNEATETGINTGADMDLVCTSCRKKSKRCVIM